MNFATTKKLGQILTWVGTPVALFFLLQQIYRYHHQLSLSNFRVEWGYLLLSALLLILQQIAFALIWHRSLRMMGAQVHYRTSLRINFSAYLLKYIPGQLWAPLKMGILQQANGISIEKSWAGIGLIQLSNALSPFLVVAVLGWSTPWLFRSTYGNLFCGMAVLVTVVSYLVVLVGPNWLSTIKKLAFLKNSSDIFLDINLWVTIAYVLSGGWYFLFFRAFCNININQTLSLLLVAALSDLVCYPLLFIPSGLGVRELSLSRLLPLVLGIGTAQCLTLSVINRVFVTAVELITIALSLAILPKKILLNTHEINI